ncbi:MAG: hypothetical protein AB7K53_01560 [Burkholderiales bacterium]
MGTDLNFRYAKIEVRPQLAAPHVAVCVQDVLAKLFALFAREAVLAALAAVHALAAHLAAVIALRLAALEAVAVALAIAALGERRSLREQQAGDDEGSEALHGSAHDKAAAAPFL